MAPTKTKVYDISRYFSKSSLQIAASKTYVLDHGLPRTPDMNGTMCDPLGIALRAECPAFADYLEGAPCGDEVSQHLVPPSEWSKVNLLVDEFAGDWDDGLVESLEEAFGLREG